MLVSQLERTLYSSLQLTLQPNQFTNIRIMWPPAKWKSKSAIWYELIAHETHEWIWFYSQVCQWTCNRSLHSGGGFKIDLFKITLDLVWFVAKVVWAETGKLGCANVYFNVRLLLNWWWCEIEAIKAFGVFSQEASQPSFPYTNLVVCNYAIGGNLIGGSMYSEVFL